MMEFRRRLMSKRKVASDNCLTFTASAGQTISLQNVGGNAPNVEYSYDKITWTSWDYSAKAFGTTTSPSIYIRGKNPSGFSHSLSQLSEFKFSNTTVGVTVSGRVMSLIDWETDIYVIPSDCCFFGLFEGYNRATSTVGISPVSNIDNLILDATTLAPYCYAYMFYSCTSLTSIPEGLLPVTDLTGCDYCYNAMFYSCTSLTSIPEGLLPATTLAPYCYSYMFGECTSLTSIPEGLLPATTLAPYCYSYMFAMCTNLETVPEELLPATVGAEGCYKEMFYMWSGRYRNDKLKKAPAIHLLTLPQNGLYHMFEACYKIDWVKIYATNISASGCLDAWLPSVGSTGDFYYKSGVSYPSGQSGCPSGWTKHTF